MPWLVPSVIAALIGTGVLAAVYFYLYAQDRQRFIAIWGMSWLITALRYSVMLLGLYLGQSPLLSVAYQFSALFSGFFLLWGTYIFLQRELPRIWAYLAAVSSFWIFFSVLNEFSLTLMSLPVFAFIATAYIWTGLVFLRSREVGGAGQQVVGWSFIIWGVHKADYPLLRPLLWFAPWGYLISATLELIIAIGILLVYFQKTKKQLLANEAKFRLFAENAKDIIYRYRLVPEPGFEYVSPSATVITGYTPEEHYADPELAGRMIHPDDRELFSAELRSPDSQKSVVFRWRRKDGKTIWTEQRNVAVYDEKGEMVAIEGIARDITERMQAEEALLQSEKRFRDVLETVNLMAVMLDVRGNITFCNDYLLGQTGWKREEVLGRNWFELFIPADLSAEVRMIFLATIKTGRYPAYYENEIITRKGDRRLIAWSNTVFRESGGAVSGITSIGADITDQERLEEQLRQSHKMEAVGRLAGGVAHDFNNILSAIIGYGNLLQMKMKEDDPLQIDVQHIMEAAERAIQVTHGLLGFSRKQIISPKPLDLNEIMRKVERLLVRIIGEDIELESTLADEKLMVMADSGQLELVLMNLATNARDAMPGGGHLTIHSEMCERDDEFIKAQGEGARGMYACISVADTGSGMDGETRKRLFEPFFTTKEVGRGTGLGLAMAYGIIKQHKGYVNVYSEPGNGTTFRIYLPVIKAEAREERKEPEDTLPKRGTETILVAEDDAALRKLSGSVLQAFGYSVIEAENGEDAVKKFRERKDDIHLVLLDMIMPKKNGKDAYDEIRKIRPDIKSLFTSGYTADIIHKKGILDEGLNFIMKPVTPNALLKKVRETLDKK